MLSAFSLVTRFLLSSEIDRVAEESCFTRHIMANSTEFMYIFIEKNE